MAALTQAVRAGLRGQGRRGLPGRAVVDNMGSRIVAIAIPIPNASTQTNSGAPISRCAASAIPPRSAPTLMVLATNSAPAAVASSHRGYFCRSAPVSPWPVTNPILAHICCTAAINGQSTGAAQRNFVPNCAPAME